MVIFNLMSLLAYKNEMINKMVGDTLHLIFHHLSGFRCRFTWSLLLYSLQPSYYQFLCATSFQNCMREREREQFQLICYLWLLMYNWVFRSLDGLHRLFVVVNVWLSVLDGLQWLVHWVPRLKGELIYLAGVKHVAGDMFESIPKGDAILLMVSFDFWVCWVFFPDFLWSYAFSFLFFFWNLVLVLMT